MSKDLNFAGIVGILLQSSRHFTTPQFEKSVAGIYEDSNFSNSSLGFVCVLGKNNFLLEARSNLKRIKENALPRDLRDDENIKNT